MNSWHDISEQHGFTNPWWYYKIIMKTRTETHDHIAFIIWVYIEYIVTAHWPVDWTILVSGYAKLVLWLSLCYHVSYEPGSIGLLRSKAVSMVTPWQSVWQPYRHKNMKDSQPDNFIVVSLTTLPAIKWCQAFCCDVMDAVQCIKNTQSKVNGLYCDKTYVQVAFSHIKNKLRL